MGADTVTTMNVSVHSVDVDKGLIMLVGAVPGPRGGLVLIRTGAKAAPVQAAGTGATP